MFEQNVIIKKSGQMRMGMYLEEKKPINNNYDNENKETKDEEEKLENFN